MLVIKENKLWTHICYGKKDSFQELYNTYPKDFYKNGLKFTAKNVVIEDLIQDLFSSELCVLKKEQNKALYKIKLKMPMGKNSS